MLRLMIVNLVEEKILVVVRFKLNVDEKFREYFIFLCLKIEWLLYLFDFNFIDFLLLG